MPTSKKKKKVLHICEATKQRFAWLETMLPLLKKSPSGADLDDYAHSKRIANCGIPSEGNIEGWKYGARLFACGALEDALAYVHLLEAAEQAEDYSSLLDALVEEAGLRGHQQCHQIARVREHLGMPPSEAALRREEAFQQIAKDLEKRQQDAATTSDTNS